MGKIHQERRRLFRFSTLTLSHYVLSATITLAMKAVGAILGWSGSTMVLMAKRYGHIGTQAKHDAVGVLDRPPKPEQRSVQAGEPTSSNSEQCTNAEPTIN